MDNIEAWNQLTEFCGPRDLPDLSPISIQERLATNQVDVAVLFGGSIIAGGDVFAEAIRHGIAKHYVIVGGHGHTTATLRQLMQTELSELQVTDQSEAALFQAYLKTKYGLAADLLETASTNCGNNITNLLALLDAQQIQANSFLLMQDASMQRRMAAGLLKERPQAQIINYATYQVRFVKQGDHLGFDHQPAGMWDLKRYQSLLMGEIPRLRDDEAGYGPRGKHFIAHVDVPSPVLAAFEQLRQQYPELIRVANQKFASHK